MELFDRKRGYCEIHGAFVQILLLKQKKIRQKSPAPIPVRCQNSPACGRSVFCRFVNPLTTRLPVDFSRPEADPAEAS
ncbi:MAG: hypothetical protein LBT97_07910 [Planctomycetota bacterium]|jgi:hypothetical protein|nr:hypothetical protein [Planctomycetota bacterium]